jgi:hypothetical protein
MAAPEQPAVRTYGNWRKPRAPGLGQLGMIGTAILLLGLVLVIITVAVAGVIAALFVLVILAAGLGTLVFRDRHGRTVLQRLAARMMWARARGAGAHLYRSGPLGLVPSGSFQLPGLVARSRLSEGRDSYNRPFALLHVPTTAHYTVVFGTEPDGASLVDQEQIDLWVAHWGQWLASLGDEPGVVAASVTIETAPDSGARLQREVLARMDENAPDVAKGMLAEVMDSYPAGSATVRAWVALTFTGAPRAGGARKDAREMARDLAARLPGLSQGLHATGAGAARPISAQELCEVVRVAYEPRTARLFDAAYSAQTVPHLKWDEVGPAAAQASWGSYRHDGAVSVSWSMTGAPRGEVQSSVLHQLLAPHRDIDRKRVTLLYQTIDSAAAARIVESDRNSANFRATSKRPTARVLREQKSAELTAREEARGAGLVNFGMIVTATVAEEERLPVAEAAIDALSATARIQLRPVYGAQDSAFVAGLPLGLILPRHLKVPGEIRGAL